MARSLKGIGKATGILGKWHKADFSKINIALGKLGTIDSARLENSVGLANQIQNTYNFDILSKHYSVNRRFLLSNGAYDLDGAVRVLSRSGQIKKPIVLFTDLPYGDRQKSKDNEWLYFSDYALKSDTDIAIISTYLWDNLPGNRDMERYIFLMLSTYVLSTYAGLEHHEKMRCCMFDYCNEPEDIDECFRGNGLCSDCENILRQKRRSPVMTIAQIAAARRLFYRSAERRSCLVIMPFDIQLRPVYERMRESLKSIGWTVTRSDELTYPKQVPEAIQEALISCDLVVADLTNNNPNVCYELGQAHAFGKDVIIVTQDELPIDIKPERAIFYKNNKRSLNQMEEQLKRQASEAILVS
jgi:nucleoside 2-deoxyribosyltransferase